MPKIRFSFWTIALLVQLALFCNANAQLALGMEPKASKFLEVRAAAASAEQTLFHLAYAVQPLCLESSVWSHGDGAHRVFGPFSVNSNPLANARREDWNQRYLLLREKFSAKPGQNILLSDQPLTPLGFSGLKKGDVFQFSDDAPPPSSEPLLAPAEVSTPDESARLSDSKDPAERRKRAEAKLDRRYAANPIQSLSVFKEGTEQSAQVRMVKVCRLTLNVLDSAHHYAHSEYYFVGATFPFIRDASDEEIKTMLAVEVAYISLGFTDSNLAGELALSLLFGRFSEIGKNRETGVRSATEPTLIQVDLLAMALAEGLGVSPARYLAVLKKFDSGKSIFGGQFHYSVTRPLGFNRIDAVQRTIDARQAGQPFPLSQKVPQKTQASILARLNAVVTNPEPIFAVSAFQGPAAKPPSEKQ